MIITIFWQIITTNYKQNQKKYILNVMISKMKKKPLPIIILSVSFAAMMIINIFALHISTVVLMLAAAAVGLTCAVVLTFLGPLYGYPAMFAGGSLYMHLLTPVAAIAEIIFLSDYSFTRRDNRLVVLSPLVYGVFYLGNNIINGIGEWPDTNAWYYFLAWGYTVGIMIFAIICVVTWLLGLAMRKLQMIA